MRITSRSLAGASWLAALGASLLAAAAVPAAAQREQPTPPGVALHAAANAGPVVSGTADGIAPGPGAPLPPGPALGTGPASLTGQVPPYTVRSGLGFGLSTDSPAPWPR